ncbi:MAG TPA: YdcF family protein [Steroidobacteraceae bacterium]|nr:YdcF family protein [Steroidobacteraceae bacterium]
MFIILKSFARTLVLPPSGSLLVALLGLSLWRRYRRLGVALVALGTISLWLLSMPVIGEPLVRLVERYPPLDPSRPVSAQAVVILGGGGVRVADEYGGPVVSNTSLDRVAYGAFLAHRNGLPILVSGAPDEAEAMRATLARNFNIPPRWVEGHSGDTFENASLSARILLHTGVRRIVLVTSADHEWRAAHEFMSAGFEVVPAPVGAHSSHPWTLLGFVPNPSGLQCSNTALYEMLGEPMRQLMAALHIRRQVVPGRDQ